MAQETVDQRIARYTESLKVLAPYLAQEFPSMGNRTPGSIVDDVGPLKEVIKEAEKVVKILQGIVDSKMTPADGNIIKGENYSMKLVPVTQRKLDQGKAKEILQRLGIPEDDYMYDLDMSQHRFSKL